MKYYVEKSLSDFEFWSGAVDRAKWLYEDDFDIIEEVLSTDGSEYSDTDINNIFWFEEDFIAELLGYNSWEELEKDRSDE